MADIKVRVGQQNTVKVVSSVSGAAGGTAINAENVIGGIASVTSLHVSGITTLAANGGITTTGGDLYVGGDLYINDDLFFDELTARNANISGIATVNTALYYTPSYTSGVAYFDSTGLMVSTGATSSAIDYSNYILTTDNSGVPTWTSTLEGGSY